MISCRFWAHEMTHRSNYYSIPGMRPVLNELSAWDANRRVAQAAAARGDALTPGMQAMLASWPTTIRSERTL